MVLTITEDSWRWVMLVGAVPALLTFVIRLFVPESERWQDGWQEGRPDPVREIFSSRYAASTLLAIGLASVALIVTWGIVQWIPLWADKMAQDGRAAQGESLRAILELPRGDRRLVSQRRCSVSLWNGAPVYFGIVSSSLFACASSSFGDFRVQPVFTGRRCLSELAPHRFMAGCRSICRSFSPRGRGPQVRGLRSISAASSPRCGAWQMPLLMGWFDKSYAKAGATISLIYFLGIALIYFAPETRNRPLPA